jgi:protein phosphatase 1G
VQAGCTAVVALIHGDLLFVANAGDSRAVLCRGGKAEPLSVDHKPSQDTERTRIVNAGGFLSEIGGICRVNGNLNLSRAIGDLRYKMNTDLPPKDQIITAHPDVRHTTLGPDDEFLVLACDGIWDVLSNQEVVDFVKASLEEGLSPEEAATKLLDHCVADDPREARGIGCDNMTAAIVCFHSAKKGASGKAGSERK